jgi:hypothetical protein
MNEMNTGASQRPTLLTVICILSFIWAGFAIIGSGLGYVGMKMMASGAVEEMVAQSGDANAMAQIEEAQAKMEESGLDAGQLANLMLVVMALSVVVLIGVIMMWKLKRTGFFVYTGAQVVSALSPVLMGGKMDMSAMGMGSLGLTVLFIVLYGMNLKHMK